jgi:hypothetical protein
MITTGTKWFFGLGLVTLVLSWAYGWTTGGNGLGPITVGYKGAVGDHVGYGVLLVAALVSFGLGIVTLAVRDADTEALRQVAGGDRVPPVQPATTSYWPAVAGFGAAVTAIGLVSEPIVFIAGLVILGVVLIEWTVQAWADRATGDATTNREIRNRLMNPVEFPAAGLLAIALVVLAFSRVFLATSAEVAVWVATGMAGLIFALGMLAASKPKLGSNLVVGLLLIAAVGVLATGVVAAVAGEREFHHVGEEGEHGEEGEEDHAEEPAEEAAPEAPVAATPAAAAPAAPTTATPVVPPAPTTTLGAPATTTTLVAP